MTWRATGVGSYRYGSCALWTVDDDLAGSGARRFAERVRLFFRGGESRLFVDLRQARSVDDLGAAALARCRDDHPGFHVIGHPATWIDLVPAVRRSLLGLDPIADLEAGLTAAAPRPERATGEQRRHPRIPLQLPVELFYAGKSAAASLRDLSRGGVRLTLVPEWFLAALPEGGRFDLLGLEEDPLGREIAAAGPLPVALVRTPNTAVLGALFSGSPPPV
ncbi:MAG: PilZ domain-containing protein [Candidatus Methylomirabilia bacterium]